MTDLPKIIGLIIFGQLQFKQSDHMADNICSFVLTFDFIQDWRFESLIVIYETGS